MQKSTFLILLKYIFRLGGMHMKQLYCSSCNMRKTHCNLHDNNFSLQALCLDGKPINYIILYFKAILSFLIFVRKLGVYIYLHKICMANTF